MSVLAKNKKAYYDYEIIEEYEAGIALKGPEVKAAKLKHLNLKGSYVSLRGKGALGELYLVNAHIGFYIHAGDMGDYDPYRARKLLLRKKEIQRLIGKTQEKGLTLVPLKMYTKHNLIKLKFALVKGKKKFDKREDIKKKDLDRQKRRLLKMRFK